MIKQITVTYSTMIQVEIPDKITEQEIFDADSSRLNVSQPIESLLTNILREAHDNIDWRDGEITDIQDCD